MGGFAACLRWHHLFAAGFLGAALVHVALEGEAYQTSFLSDLKAGDRTLVSGLATLLLFALVIFAALWLKGKRRTWLLVHRLSILGLLGIGLHMFFVQPVLPGFATFREGLFWGAGLLLFGEMILLTVHVARPYWLYRSQTFVVQNVQELSEHMRVIKLSWDKGGELWRSGNYGFFSFNCTQGCGVSREFHVFTILERDQDTLSLAVQERGDDTAALQGLQVGTRGRAMGPYGAFLLGRSKEQALLAIAGGMGIIPFLGVIDEWAREQGPKADVYLLALHREGQKWPWQSLLETRKQACPWLHVHELWERPGEYLAMTSFEQMFPDWRQAHLALSGPPLMVKAWTGFLRSKGIKQKDIHTEDFMR